MSDRLDPHSGLHSGLHSEQGALAGEHPGRARDPIVKVQDLAWLEFAKPDLDRAEAFPMRSGSAQRCATRASCICGGATRARRAC
jgi:hypothetical protein